MGRDLAPGAYNVSPGVWWKICAAENREDEQVLKYSDRNTKNHSVINTVKLCVMHNCFHIHQVCSKLLTRNSPHFLGLHPFTTLKEKDGKYFPETYGYRTIIVIHP